MFDSSSSPKSFHILLIEDSKKNATSVQRELKHSMKGICFITQVVTLAAALNAIATQKFDIVLLDSALPDAGEFSSLHSIQNTAPDLPIIYLTGHKDEKTALECIRQGAQDYVVKDNMNGEHLKKAIQFAILRKEYEGVLRVRANCDMLTGLFNRMTYERRLEIALAKVKQHDRHLAVLFVDLNKFKAVNDAYGHATGDELLIKVGERLKNVVRPYDTVSRFGGDEFAILIEELNTAESSEQIATQIMKHFEPQFTVADKQLNLSVSIGISCCSAQQPKSKQLLVQQADEAMYVSKKYIKSTYTRYF